MAWLEKAQTFGQARTRYPGVVEYTGSITKAHPKADSKADADMPEFDIIFQVTERTMDREGFPLLVPCGFGGAVSTAITRYNTHMHFFRETNVLVSTDPAEKRVCFTAFSEKDQFSECNLRLDSYRFIGDQSVMVFWLQSMIREHFIRIQELLTVLQLPL